MAQPRGRRYVRRLLVLASALLCGILVMLQLPANALTIWDTPEPVTGNSTWFYALGGPYGGCGMPQSALESQNFVALNVYDLPGDYSTFYNRPMDPSLASKMGMWNNGHNCNRWVRVTIGDYCTGANDGAPNKAFCRDGQWVSDAYNGATLNMLVADSCGDGNAWCRDDPYHLDLAEASLNRFLKNGVEVGDMQPNHFNNRKITWEFIEAPNYTGDIQIGFLQSAQAWWPAIAVSRLPNGIHGVEYFTDGEWHRATMNGDMGQSYILGPAGASTFHIRVYDADDQLLNGGRVYTFSMPDSCGDICGQAYTKATYTTSEEPPTDPTPEPGTGSCSVAGSVKQSWPGGHQVEFTVTNTGTAATNGWSVAFALPSGQTLRGSWNATVTAAGTGYTATNAGYNGVIAAGASTTWGIVVDGDGPAPADLTCTTW